MNTDYLHARLKQIPEDKSNGMVMALTEIEDWFFNEGHPDIAKTVRIFSGQDADLCRQEIETAWNHSFDAYQLTERIKDEETRDEIQKHLDAIQEILA